MITRLILLFSITFCSLNLISKTSNTVVSPSPFTASKQLVLNNLDSLIFDLASSTITSTYIDIPIYIKSDDLINSFDYSIQFNLAKLTYSTTMELTADPTIQSAAYFNTINLKLKYTSFTLSSYPTAGPIVYLTKVRFLLSSPCLPITTADFYTIIGYLNGIVVPTRFTNLDFSQFIPTANYTNGPTCSNASVQFANTSTVQTGAVNSYTWNFGNGVSNSQNPSHSYTATGTSAATLIVKTDIGCRDTIIKPLTISPPPVSSFSYSFDCIKDSVFFTNASSVTSGTVTGAQWNFGDQSGTSNSLSPTYHYNSSGFFTVSLVSTSNFSCSATSTIVVDLSNKVSASFTNSSANNCLGSSFSFTDGTTYALSPINSWSWNFGDGNTSAQQNTSHTYTTAGSYTITLTSGASDGCKGSISKVLNIEPPPAVQFAAGSTTGCANTPVTFTDLSTTPVNSNYTWHFGDATTSELQNPAHSYTTGGTYSVKLVVVTPAGCSDSLTKTSYLVINNSPVGNFSLSSACIQVNVQFHHQFSIATGSITSWLWNFGTDFTSTQQNPIYSYAVSGTYIVSLTATSDLGCIGTATQAIILSQKPVINFIYTSGLDCSGETLSFLNQSTPASGPSYVWRFGDGSSSVLPSPIHTYMNSGFYAIKLIAINPGGCSDSLTKPYTVTLPAPVTANFTESVTANGTILFTNTSSNFIKSKWDFGDNTNSIIESPLHTFPEITNYNVCLTVFNSLNCPDSLCKDIFTGISRIVAIPSSFTPNDDNTNDMLRVRGGPFAEMEFQIYNEWGNLIFSSNTQELGWDGRYNGEAQPVGAYEYVLRGKTLENKKINLYGVVNLTR